MLHRARRIHCFYVSYAIRMNALAGIVISLFGATWAIVALLYVRKHPEKLTGMNYRTFQRLCIAIIVICLGMCATIPFVLR